VGHGLGDDHEAIAENVLLDVADFRGGSHNSIVTQAERKSAWAAVPEFFCHRAKTRSQDWLCYNSFSSGWSLPYSLV
jgi:hypothetical protein